MNIFKVLLSFSFVIIFNNYLIPQINNQNLDSLLEEIELLIGDSWFLEQTNQGFQVTYCRSCSNAYKDHLDSVDIFERRKTRSDFFAFEKLDSISYFPTVSNIPVSPKLSEEQRIQYFTDLYKPTDILRFNVIIENKWPQAHFDSVFTKNNILKECILKEPLFKTSKDIFSDYRFWIPDNYWKPRTQEFDFYFERMPYSSLTMAKSIFIEHNKPNFFCEPMFIDKNDREFFYKSNNLLEDERRRTLKVIALALGVHDYKVVN